MSGTGQQQPDPPKRLDQALSEHYAARDKARDEAQKTAGQNNTGEQTS